MQLCRAAGRGYHRLVLRVIEVSAAGTVIGGEELAHKRPGRVLHWVDVQGQTIADMERLRDEFGLHPLAVEDCLSFDQRPKVNDYPEHLFLVIHGFTCPSGDPSEVEIHELHCFLLENTVITVHERSIPALDDVYRRAERDHVIELVLEAGTEVVVAVELIDAHAEEVELAGAAVAVGALDGVRDAVADGARLVGLGEPADLHPLAELEEARLAHVVIVDVDQGDPRAVLARRDPGDTDQRGRDDRRPRLSPTFRLMTLPARVTAGSPLSGFR